MNEGELHILGVWSANKRLAQCTDSSLAACAEHVLARAQPLDRVLLIADEQGERRAVSMGIRTPLVLPPSALRWHPRNDPLSATLRHLIPPARVLCWNDAWIGMLVEEARDAWPGPVPVLSAWGGAPLPRRVPAPTRGQIRSLLEIEDEECVIALAADPPDALSAHDFIRACALIALVGRRVTAIVPRQAPDIERMKTTLRTTGIPVRVIMSEAPIWTVLPATDAIIPDVIEGSHPRSCPANAQRFIAAAAARLGIPVAWPGDERFEQAWLENRLVRARSRLAVHIARALNEHLLRHRPELVRESPVGSGA